MFCRRNATARMHEDTDDGAFKMFCLRNRFQLQDDKEEIKMA